MIDFLIASTGRSGSRYVSKALTQSGINTGHEDYFPAPHKNPSKNNLKGDSSCFSIPHLERFKGFIVHQVRNPLHVLTSLSENEEKIKKVRGVYDYRMSFVSNPTGDFLIDMMECIIAMNNEIDKHKHIMWKVEEFNYDCILRLSKQITCDFTGASKALKSVSKKDNKHHDNEYFTWSDLPDCKSAESLKEHARYYGY